MIHRMTAISGALLLGSGVMLLACGGGSTTPEGGAASAGGEPAIVITDQAEWDSLAEQGKVSYDAACGDCHPGGDADLGPAIKGHQETVAAMTEQIRAGSGRMKPIDESKLPEDQMKGLMVYLATIDAVGNIQGP